MRHIAHAMSIARRYAAGGSDDDEIDPVIMPGNKGAPRLTRVPAQPLPSLPESPDQKVPAQPEESFTEQREREGYHPYQPAGPDPIASAGQNAIFGAGMDVARPISEGPSVQNVAGAAAALPLPGAAERPAASEAQQLAKAIANELVQLHGGSDNAHKLISEALINMSPRADTAVLQHLPPSIRDGVIDHRLKEAMDVFKDSSYSDKDIEQYYQQQNESETHQHALATGTPDIADPDFIQSVIKPLDWQSYKNSNRLTPEDMPRWDKAVAAGFNPNAALYRGSRTREGYPREWQPPQRYRNESGTLGEPAVFLSDDKTIARSYAYGMGEKGITKWVARGDKIGHVDWTDIIPPYDQDPYNPGLITGSDYDSHTMDHLVRAGHKAGYDMLVIDNMFDQGRTGEAQTQYAVLNPAILRAPHAQFMTKYLKKSYPLLGVAGGTLFTYGNMRGDKE